MTHNATPQNQFPLGWDQQRVQQLIAHYDSQTEAEAIAEDEAILESGEQTVMTIPTELVATVRNLIAKHQAS